MDSVKSWVISVVSCVILTIIITFVTPEGRLGKVIKCVFSIVVSLVILQPITYVFDNEFDYVFSDVTLNNLIQTDYLDYVFDVKIKSLKSKAKLVAENNGITNAEFEIIVDDQNNLQFLIKEFRVYLDKAVISSNKEHIDIIESLKNDLSKNLSIEIDKVIIYE